VIVIDKKKKKLQSSDISSLCNTLASRHVIVGIRKSCYSVGIDSFSGVLLIVKCCCYCCCCPLLLLLLVSAAAAAAAAGGARPSGKACVCRKSIAVRAKELTAVF
jgi:hypothetical protein